jgi:hypothetical protein
MINQIPQPPIAPMAPHGPMLYYAIFNWALDILCCVLVLREAYRTKSAFPLAFIFGGMLAAWVEPVFDGNIHVQFVYPAGVEPSWHIYNVPYPWYEFAGNATLAGPIYWIYHRMRKGASSGELWLYFVLAWAADALQELPGTIMGAYVYFGPQPFVVAHWPFWIGMLAPIGYALAAYAGYAMSFALSGVRLFLAQVIIMPVAIYGAEVIAWPMWDTLNAGQTVTVTSWAAILSLIFTVVAYSALIAVYLKRREGVQLQPGLVGRA